MLFCLQCGQHGRFDHSDGAVELFADPQVGPGIGIVRLDPGLATSKRCSRFANR
jgi:hypothetical protein